MNTPDNFNTIDSFNTPNSINSSENLKTPDGHVITLFDFANATDYFR